MSENKCDNCPYFVAQKVIKGKWSVMIMYFLNEGVHRFNELERRLEGITHATLSRQLKDLEETGLVIRKEYPQVPPKVEYSLTEVGKDLIPVMISLEKWGKKYTDYMTKANCNCDE